MVPLANQMKIAEIFLVLARTGYVKATHAFATDALVLLLLCPPISVHLLAALVVETITMTMTTSSTI